MKKFSNIKIGMRLALVFGVNICLVACLTGVAFRTNSTMKTAISESQRFNTMTTLSEKLSRNSGAIAQCVATMVLSRQVDQKVLDRLLAARTDYLASFAELHSLSRVPEGRRLLGEIEDAATRWRETDNRVIDLLRAHKTVEANTLYEEKAITGFTGLSEELAAYVAFREKRSKDNDAGAEAMIGKMASLLALAGILALVGSAISSILITRSIVRPLAFAVTRLDQVAKGDVSRDVPQEYLDRRDEIGLLSNAVQRLSMTLRGSFKEIAETISLLSSSSARLSASSGQMSDSSRETSEKAHAVAAAAEQMTSNVTSVAAGMEQTATNLTNVSSHTEQMTATIGEIAGNSEKARQVTGEAARQTGDITERMHQLGQAAREIGKVTETITEISSQTNLLALNATIEAARAGAAGKGFAVVANEIKELAQQTAQATEDIRARIEGVQTSTTGGIAGIEKVAKVINDVNEIVTSIAAAIEEQSTVTKDIARNIVEASIGVKGANERVLETSQAAGDIAREILVVDRDATQLTRGSEQVRSSASDLMHAAEQLQSAVSRFHIADANQDALRSALTAHAAWSSRLRAAIRTGKLDVAVGTIGADNACQFGKWLYGAQLSESDKQSAIYRSVRQLHGQFHEEAAKVAQLAISQQQKAAEEAMAPSSEFARLSSTLTKAIEEWCASA
jgi:methyl-accepting chemotaxis protein